MARPTYAATAWAAQSDCAGVWLDGEKLAPSTWARLVEAATEQARVFAPVLPDDAEIPAGYVMGTILHTRELAAAAKRDGDVIAGDVYAIRARDLTAAVRACFRPKRGRPGIG